MSSEKPIHKADFVSNEQSEQQAENARGKRQFATDPGKTLRRMFYRLG